MSSIEQKKNLFSAFNWHFSLAIRFGPILLFISCACGHMGCAAEVRLSKNGCAQKCCNNNNNESIHSLRNSMAATQCQHTPPLHICITKWPNAFGRPHLASGANRLQWRSTPFEMSSPASVMVIYFILFMEATGIINLFFAPLFSLPLHLSRFFLPCRVEQCPIPNTSKILTSHFQMRFTFRSPLQRCAHFYFFHYFYCISSSLMCPVVSYFVGFYFPFFLCVFFGLSGVRRQRLLSFGNVRRSFVFRDQIQRNEKQKKKNASKSSSDRVSERETDDRKYAQQIYYLKFPAQRDQYSPQVIQTKNPEEITKCSRIWIYFVFSREISSIWVERRWTALCAVCVCAVFVFWRRAHLCLDVRLKLSSAHSQTNETRRKSDEWRRIESNASAVKSIR